MSLGTGHHNEAGVTTIFIAMSMVMLLGAVGLGVDTGSLRYQRSKVQHSADASALAIAYDCAANKQPACSNYQATAVDLTNANSAGASPAVTLGLDNVRVKVDNTVPMHFFKAFGITSKLVSGSAKVVWTGRPTSGPVIPFAVSLCEYLSKPIQTATLLRTDLNDVTKNEIPKKNTDPLTKVYTIQLPPYLTASGPCTVPADARAKVPGLPATVTMLEGGLWLSDAGNSTSNGKLLSTTILESLTSVTGYVQSGWKFADYLGSGKTLLMAIYAPTGPDYLHAGFHVMDDGSPSFPGYYDMKIVGYAPFVVSGWCMTVSKSGVLSDCGGTPPSSVGIAGKFVTEFSKDPAFTYGNNGTDFGAYDVHLSE